MSRTISEKDLIKSSHVVRARETEGKKTCYCSRQALYGGKCFVDIARYDDGTSSGDEMFSLQDLNILFLRCG